jgi:hypothetical protein
VVAGLPLASCQREVRVQRVAAASFALLCAAPAARAADAEAIESEHRRRGFFVRLDVGLGAIGMGNVQAPVNHSLSPVAVSVGVLLGAAISERVVLGLEIAGLSSDDSPLSGVALDKNRFVLAYLGPHASFYVLPRNGYLSVGVGLGAVQTAVDGGAPTWSSKGLAGRLGIGKEFWVGSHGALGVCGQFWFGAGRDWSSPAVGLAVSFAHN